MNYNIELLKADILDELDKIQRIKEEFIKLGDIRKIDFPDNFFNFNKDLSKGLYYKLRNKRDSSGNKYYNDAIFRAMFGQFII